MQAREYLKSNIENRGITYSFISKKTEISIDTISKSLNGNRRLLADELLAICNAISIDMDDLKVAGTPTQIKTTQTPNKKAR